MTDCYIYDAVRTPRGKGLSVRKGRDVSLIGTGMTTCRLMEAAEILASKGVDA